MSAHFDYQNPPPSRDTQADLDRIPDHFAKLAEVYDRGHRPHAVPAALDCLRDTLPLMRKACSLAYLHRDMELHDLMRAQINRNAEALAEATKQAA